jgi:hypothetical protein
MQQLFAPLKSYGNQQQVEQSSQSAISTNQQWRTVMTVQLVADYHRISMKQQIGKLSSSSTPNYRRSTSHRTNRFNRVERHDNVTIVCSIEFAWKWATICYIVVSHHRTSRLSLWMASGSVVASASRHPSNVGPVEVLIANNKCCFNVVLSM